MSSSSAVVGAVVVAAGSGERFSAASRSVASSTSAPRTPSPQPTYKQFCWLAGEPLVCRATRTAAQVADDVVVVLPSALIEGGTSDDQGEVVAALVEFGATVVAGGTSRATSVLAGLRALAPTVERVVVHDAVRPAAPTELFTRTLAQLDHADGAVPGMRPSDTIKVVALPARASEQAAGHRVVETLDRSQLVAVQTPQAFRRDVLERAYACFGDAGSTSSDWGTAAPTDCAGLVERAGGNVVTVEGHALAHKITTPDDLVIVEALLAQRAS